MLFWIWIILLVVGIALFTADMYSRFDFEKLGMILSSIGFMGTFIAGLVLIGCHINVDGLVAENHVRYDMLVYQYENDIYENDNDLGKRELMKDIQDWNEDLASNRHAQNDFWVGIFHPDIFDQFEFIELKENTNA